MGHLLKIGEVREMKRKQSDESDKRLDLLH